CVKIWINIYGFQMKKIDTVQKEVRVVTQLQFISWPDHDVPHKASGVIDLLHRVQDLHKSSPDLVRNPQNRTPRLVHCSAGCGRTGVICALDHIYQLLTHQVGQWLTPDFSILRIVTDLRQQRPSTVQTKVGYTNSTLCLKWSTSFKSELTLPASRKTDVAHHYDNLSATSAPIYSVVRPRAKPHPTETHMYDLATPTSPDVTPHYHLLSGCSLFEDSILFFTFNIFRFNRRVPKPRGPRDPPAEWTRLER
uniref:protein-tyrosine-phosphatase n=1 Tax=Neogobius melanostomus TaxID=47308 RepID=A0A8C6TK28_9GOBI